MNYRHLGCPKGSFNVVVSPCLLHDRIRHAVELLWTSDQPIGNASVHTGQHNTETQRQNIHASSGIRTHDPSNQEAKTNALDSAVKGTGSLHVIK
jgi:hypothetical protein